MKISSLYSSRQPEKSDDIFMNFSLILNVNKCLMIAMVSMTVICLVRQTDFFVNLFSQKFPNGVN